MPLEQDADAVVCCADASVVGGIDEGGGDLASIFLVNRLTLPDDVILADPACRTCWSWRTRRGCCC